MWTASGSEDHSGSQCGHPDPCNPDGPEKTHEAVEIFTPWYVNAERPAISECPASMVADGRRYHLTMESGGRGAGNVERVVLMRPGQRDPFL